MAKRAMEDSLPIIFIGGYSTNMDTYKEEITILENYGRVVHFLNPGWGVGYDIDLLMRKVDEVRRYMHRNGIHRADFIGHSLGGAISVFFAHRNKEMTGDVVLINPVGILGGDSLIKLASRAVQSVYLEIRRAHKIGQAKRFLSWARTFIFVQIHNPILRVICEPIIVYPIDIIQLLEDLKSSDSVCVYLLQSVGDTLLPIDNTVEIMNGNPFDFVDVWMVYVNRSATHNAPSIENPGVLLQILNRAS